MRFLFAGICLAIAFTGVVVDDKPPPAPIESIDDGNGLISTGLTQPGSNHPGRSGGSANDASDQGAEKAPPYCRITDLGANPEEEKRLDVNCGDPATGGGGPLITTAILAQQVANQLPIPKPDLQIRPFTTYPDGARGGLTGAPMWLWIGSTWKPLTQHTELGQIWVTVVATPTKSSWSFGDGTAIACRGKGTPLTDPTQGLRGSPTCGHTYKSTSSAFKITASVTWTISWTGSGNTGGILAPLNLTNTTPYAVKQARSQLVAPH